MDIELRFFATFREAVGEKTIHREYDTGTTVGGVLAALESEFPDLEGQLVEDGTIREHLSVLRNGREVVHLDGPDTTLDDGDAVSVFPPVAGGRDGRPTRGRPTSRGDRDNRAGARASGDGRGRRRDGRGGR